MTDSISSRQNLINTCRKVTLKANFLDDDILLPVTYATVPLQEMEGECKKMQKEAEEDFGDGCLAR
jgi:hypothetical protein